MNDILEYLINGQLWLALVLILAVIVTPFLKKGFLENPRLKYFPLWSVGILFFPVLIFSLNLISITTAWLIIGVLLLLTGYLYAINHSISVSHEKLILKVLSKGVKNLNVEKVTAYYTRNKRFFITHLGKYHLGLVCLDNICKSGVHPDCFVIVDEIHSLKLTNDEKRVVVLKQLNLYTESQALRLMEHTYESKRYVLNLDDQYYIEAILAYHKLQLDRSEELFQKLLANATSEEYRQIATNNIAVIAENRLESIECNDNIYKSFTISQKIKSNEDKATLNLIDNHISHNKIEKAEELFQNYIQSHPSQTLSQRINLFNTKLHYYRQTNDLEKLASVINDLWQDYHTAEISDRYTLLLSLFRISLNHKILFDQVLTELESQIDKILDSDFALVRWATQEIMALPDDVTDSDLNLRIERLIHKCITKVNSIDIDLEISKLRIEDVITKRSYMKFKAIASMFKIDIKDFEQYKESLFEKFRIIDELILFDVRQGLLMNLLDSLMMKLDEITNSLNIIARTYRIPVGSNIYEILQAEGNRLILEILPIIKRAETSPLMAQYHLQLAHYYCCLGNKDEGFKQFQKFKQTNVNLLHYADWLRQWYIRLDSYFKKNQEGLFISK